jgi:hypothetical protein
VFAPFALIFIIKIPCILVRAACLQLPSTRIRRKALTGRGNRTILSSIAKTRNPISAELSCFRKCREWRGGNNPEKKAFMPQGLAWSMNSTATLTYPSWKPSMKSGNSRRSASSCKNSSATWPRNRLSYRYSCMLAKERRVFVDS